MYNQDNKCNDEQSSHLINWASKLKAEGELTSLTYTIKHGSRVIWLAQAGFAAFGKGVRIIAFSVHML